MREKFKHSNAGLLCQIDSRGARAFQGVSTEVWPLWWQHERMLVGRLRQALDLSLFSTELLGPGQLSQFVSRREHVCA